MVATNGDVVHSYGLIKAHPRGRTGRSASSRSARFSPSLFVVHFGLQGTFRHPAPFDPVLGLATGRCSTTSTRMACWRTTRRSICIIRRITDPAMAPPGRSTFYALAPVPHLGKLDVDWAVEGPRYPGRRPRPLEERLIPGLRERIETIFHYTPADFTDDLGAHLGSAFSLEPVLTQSAWFRVHNRDDVLQNLYFVGAGTHPGAGIPGVVGSAKATAGLMIDDLAGADRAALVAGAGESSPGLQVLPLREPAVRPGDARTGLAALCLVPRLRRSGRRPDARP